MTFATTSCIHQAAALPWARVGRELRIVLVTSRRKSRWILPKGHLETGSTSAEAAAMEAWEEAGVTGAISHTPLGAWEYTKRGQLHRADIFPLEVVESSPRYPDAHKRARIWLPFEEAIARLDDDALVRVVSRLPEFLRRA